jgi:rod shape determining protein RodA
MKWRHLTLLGILALLVMLPVILQLVHYIRYFYPALQSDPALSAPWWYILKPYQCNRILVFLDPNFDPYNAGWNLLQCKIAVGSGGYLGKGFLHGSQNLLGFLPRPVAPTDFIFSVLAEELGFRGVILLLGLYTVLLTRMILIGLRCRQEPSRSLLAGGIAIIFFCHIFVNLGMTIGLMPITGLPLPLMSYGGSFLLGSMLALGMIQAVFVRRQP